MRDFILVCKHSFLFSSNFLPRKAEEVEPAILGMSLTTLREVYTPINFPILEGRSWENLGLLIAHFSII